MYDFSFGEMTKDKENKHDQEETKMEKPIKRSSRFPMGTQNKRRPLKEITNSGDLEKIETMKPRKLSIEEFEELNRYDYGDEYEHPSASKKEKHSDPHIEPKEEEVDLNSREALNQTHVDGTQGHQ
jgi:hypothetical protein